MLRRQITLKDLSNLARSVPEGLAGNMEPHSRPAKLLLASEWVNMPNGLYIGLYTDLYSLVNWCRHGERLPILD